GRCRLIAADPDLARQTRLRDRFFDLYVHMQMQKIVGDRLRPEDKRDLFGVAEARRLLSTALELIDESMAGKEWAMGEDFTMADCAAAPALWYANEAQPFADTHPNTFDYLERLKARPSFSRALREAEPYLHLFPR
ncbi:MAG: glutathione S-transferase family protein, partial [Alphaproteobacteria bacterium]|nr:glutathione S-transferase family protein [Alphaproteobacteria bacterium]